MSKLTVVEALNRIERIEGEYREAMSRRESAENIAARFSCGSPTREKAVRSFMVLTEKVIKLRKELAQATLTAYGAGLGKDGNIIWSDE